MLYIVPMMVGRGEDGRYHIDGWHSMDGISYLSHASYHSDSHLVCNLHGNKDTPVFIFFPPLVISTLSQPDA